MIELNTLGGKSKFHYEIHNDILYLKFGKLIKPFIIKSDIIEKVKTRVINSPENLKFMASNYNKSKWDDCPNNRVCPYLAQMILKDIL